MENNQVPAEKSAIQKVLEGQFDTLLEQINKRFADAGDQVGGLSKWMALQLNIVTRKITKAEVQQSVIDVSTTALLELMFEKNVISKEDYEKKVNEIVVRKSANAPKS